MNPLGRCTFDIIHWTYLFTFATLNTYIPVHCKLLIVNHVFVKVTSDESQAYKVTIYLDGKEAPATIYGYPGGSVKLEAGSDDGKSHSYTWRSTYDAISVDGGQLGFGLGESGKSGFAWYAESLVRAKSADGCSASINAVSSVNSTFRLGNRSETIGSEIVIPDGKSFEISLSWFNGEDFTDLPDAAFSIKSKNAALVRVDGKNISTAKGAEGETELSYTICDREFLLCKVTVEKGGSKDSSGEIYIEEPVIW